MPMQAQPNGSETARIEVIGGQPVVFVGDRMFALPAVSATNSRLPPSGTAAMDPSMKRAPDASTSTMHGNLPGAAFGPPRSSTHTPFAGMDIAALKTQQALKKQELRTVEQTEVLQASHQSEAWRASMIEKKRCLIVELDALRKQIVTLEAGGTTAQPSAFPKPVGAPTAPVLPFGTQNQQPFAPAMYPFPAANQYAPMGMYQPQPQPYGGFPNFPTVEPAPFVPSSTNIQTPHSPPGSSNRRSRAIEIKPPPPEDVKKPSALNPKSPTYEPATKSSTMQGTVSPTPSPEKTSPWRTQDVSEASKHDRGVPSQKHSLSSVDTMDFFPTNTHEHSSTRVAPQIQENKSSIEPAVAPTTPEKHWPASPWNEGHSGRSTKNEAPKLTSWPEAFGKQPSTSSLRPSTASQSFSAKLERSSAVSALLGTSASSSNAAPRTNSEQHTGTNHNWPLSEKPVAHVPSTYQEGYQAGYDHVGIPDSPDVLQGYIQGLLHFLADEAKKRQAEYQRSANSRTPSLRGLVAGSLPHDTGISMGVNRNGFNGGQENIRLSKANLTDEGRREFGQSLQGNVQNVPGQYNVGGEESRQRVASSAQYFNSPVLFIQRMPSSQRQVVIPNMPKLEDDASARAQGKGIEFRGDSQAKGGASQQSFGTLMQNRAYGTPLPMQRFYTTSKEPSTNKIGEYNGSSGRSFADVHLTGLDGAMDDLAEMIDDTRIDESHTSVAAEDQSSEAQTPVEYEESNASCFKSSNNKGKQKAPLSPAKMTDTERETVASSRTNTPGSPKKGGEHSPAKAKLEQVTNKFRRSKKDEGRTMSPEERTKRSEKWRQRFQQLKRTELEEIEAHRRNSRT